MHEPPMPLAIIGIACRLPGDVKNTDELWNLLLGGRSAWSPVPADRFNETAFYHPDPDHDGTTNHRGGHFLSQDIAAFDPAFFGISPVEAHAMDPQQRLLLETAYEAFENAGVPLEQARGSNTAVYTATFTRDYDRNMYRDPATIPKYHLTGNGEAIVSNRISYIFDLKGPSLTLDTGCSGSLVALHHACRSLRTGESDMALASGVTLVLNPDHLISMSNQHMLNDDGRSYAFDARGSGYGRGEGVTCLLLKRLDDALKAGDTIRAVIRDTAVNQDGRTSGITLPSQQAQEALQRSIFRTSGIDPLDIDYVEAHGTGTVAGDQAELQAIAKVFCENRTSNLHVGSIKSNIGHLESASGLAGVIKAILVLENKLIPPNHDFQVPKASLKLGEWKIKVPSKLVPYPGSKTPRVSVNSFGYGGTNAHVILEKAPASRRQGLDNVNASKSTQGSEPRLFIFSARSEQATNTLVENLRVFISRDQQNLDFFQDLAYTLSCRRSLMQWRLSIVATHPQELISAMQPERIRDRGRQVSSNVQLAFTFTGQGAQWFAMGRDLLSVRSQFSFSLSTSNAILKDIGAPWDLLHELSLTETASRINQSEIAQPATTALQIALVDLLRSIGIQPQVVLGHSSGEIGAAYAAGSLSQTAALKISYYRGLVSSKCKESISMPGAMLAVGLGEDDVLKHITKIKSGIICVACVNSSTSTTISGDEPAILELKASLDHLSIFNRKLNVQTAYHSHHMQQISAEYLHSLVGLEQGAPPGSVKFISSVTAMDKTTDFGPAYWVENLVSKVRYSDAVKVYCSIDELRSARKGAQPQCILIEIGPHSALSGPTRQTLRESGALNFTYLPTLVRGQDGVVNILELVGRLFEYGVSVDFDTINSIGPTEVKPVVIPSLPTYPWDHSNTYWYESRLSKEYRLRPNPDHDLLGVRVPSSTAIEPRWRYMVGLKSLPWLDQHVVDEMVVFPGAGYVCMAIEAIRQIARGKQWSTTNLAFVAKNISFLKALVIPPMPHKVELQLSLSPVVDKRDKEHGLEYDFRVTALSQYQTWYEHCRGSIRVELVSQIEQGCHEISEACESKWDRLRPMNAEKYYKDLEATGNTYGPLFAAVTKLSLDRSRAMAYVDIPDVASAMPSNFMQPHVIHPATLDALMHSSLALYRRQYGPGSIMPVFIREIAILSAVGRSPGTRLLASTAFAPNGPRSGKVDISVLNSSGGIEDPLTEPVVRISGLELRGLGQMQGSVPTVADMRKISYQMIWNSDVDFLLPAFLEPSSPIIESSRISAEHKLQVLNHAASIYIHRCLESINANGPQPAQAHLTELTRWIKRHHLSKSQTIVDGMSKPGEEDFLNQVFYHGVEGEMLSRIGLELAPILAGKIDPLQLMLEDGLLYRFDADDASRRSYAHMKQYVRHLCFKNPHMSVLQIGAGSGSATLPSLEGLTEDGHIRLCSYDLTDTSVESLDRARMTFQKWADVLHFKILDIESDPVAQGFEPHSYDLIVAANVLHTMKSIDQTLENVHKLLRPGGRLLIVEFTQPQAFLDLVLGTLPAWWNGVGDGREHSPLLSREQWHRSLLRNNFTGAEFAVNDIEGPAQISAMMVTRAVGSKTPIVHRRATIIVENDTRVKVAPFIDDLCLELESLGFRSQFISWSSPDFQTEDNCIVLDDGQQPLLVNPSAVQFSRVSTLLQQRVNVLWISLQNEASAARNPEKALVTGLARTAHAENEHLNLVTLDVQEALGNCQPGLPRTITTLLLQSINNVPETIVAREREYVYRDGQLLIPRLKPNTKLHDWIARTVGRPEIEVDVYGRPDRPLRLYTGLPSPDGKILFIDDKLLQAELDPASVEIDVRAHGTKLADVLAASGHTKPESMMGECAGLVTAVGSASTGLSVGDRVCAWGGALYASRARVHRDNVRRLPDSTPFTLGASIPIAFMTAYYSLVELSDLQKGQTLLVHSAGVDIGEAAVLIARHIGAEIFTTVSTSTERGSLMKTMDLSPAQVLLRQGPSFKYNALELTHGHGFDVVLDCSHDEDLDDTWASVASLGTVIQISQPGTSSKDQKKIIPVDKNAAFIPFDLATLYRERPYKTATLLGKVFSMFEKGGLTPCHSITSFPLSRIGEALKMARGRQHSGKIVLEVEKDTKVDTINPNHPVAKLASNATYVIAGGLGDLGQRLCRLMVKRGARHIWVLSRRELAPLERWDIEAELQLIASDCKFYYTACDISIESRVQEAISSGTALGLPPIRGIIQAGVVLRDCTLSNMTLEDYKIPLQTKLKGTRHLHDALRGSSLDFFVLLASTVGIIGTTGQANYTSGNTFQDAFAASQTNSTTHYMSLDIGLLADASVNTQLIERRLQEQGLVPITPEELLAAFEYCISADSSRDNCKQAIIGFNEESLLQAQGPNSTSRSALFSHIRRLTDDSVTGNAATVSASPHETVIGVEDPEEVVRIITTAVARKISGLIVSNDELVRSDVSMMDLGLDSLMAIELKNWIAREYDAAIQASDIVDHENVVALAATIASTSKIVSMNQKPSASRGTNRNSDISEPAAVGDNQIVPSSASLPKQPLPLLEDTMQLYLDTARSFCSDAEYEATCLAVANFKEPIGLGQQLHARLLEKDKDPQTENWIADMYTARRFLRLRTSLVDGQSYYGTHPHGRMPHGQAERAALLSLAGFNFKRAQDSGDLGPQYLGGQMIDPETYQWLFSASREPGIEEDRILKHPQNDYTVVFRYGHAFKVSLKHDFQTLKVIFDKILAETPKQMSGVGVLTADKRDRWAKLRKAMLETSNQNKASIHTIEAAAFIVCLDDARPENPQERFSQFIYGDGSNRWYDKSLQFVVCENGVSASIMEHACLDAISIGPLQTFLNQAILDHGLQNSSVGDPSQTTSVGPLEELLLTFPANISAIVPQVRQNLISSTSHYSFASLSVPNIGQDFFQAHKLPIQSGIQLILQLAARAFFSKITPAIETVSMAHFRKGRVEVNYPIQPAVATFLAVVNSTDITTATISNLRSLFYAAAKAHATSLVRANRGRGFNRHMLALEWVLREGEVAPTLFHDSVYARMKSVKMVTSSFETGWLEGGFVYPVKGGVIVYFEVHKDSVSFSIFGNDANATSFGELVKRSAQEVHGILG